jgi:putative hydrolase of the HAD superfamily
VPVLLCDLDDTLFDHDRATRDSLAELRRAHQVLGCWSLDELDARHRALLEALHIEVLAGRLLVDEARRERFSRLLDQAGAQDGALADELASAYRTTYASNWHPVAGALDLLRAVRAEGHAVVIVTNNGLAEQQLKLERCGIGACVDAMVTSEEAGVCKPDQGIFEYALARVSAPASAAVMLGDAWAADIEGARAAGVTPVWFNPHGRQSPDPSVAELASLAPVDAALAVLREAGLAERRERPGGGDESGLRAD